MKTRWGDGAVVGAPGRCFQEEVRAQAEWCFTAHGAHADAHSFARRGQFSWGRRSMLCNAFTCRSAFDCVPCVRRGARVSVSCVTCGAVRVVCAADAVVVPAHGSSGSFFL